MAQINPSLLTRLMTKLSLSKAGVYARIERVANREMLDRHHAALVLAAQQGINIQKYSSPEDRAAIRGSLTSNASSVGAGSPAIPTGIPNRSKRRRNLPKGSRTKDNSVFVVHGRDEALRKSMFEFLRALTLNPMEWSKAVLLPKSGGANPHVDDILDTAMNRVQAVVVIFSPDDEAKLRDPLIAKGEKSTEGKLQGQPRPNVIFEAGLALGRHPEKTLLVQVGKVRGFSDIAGKHLVRLTNDVEKRKDVANRLGRIGCKVDLDGDDWISAGDFTPKA